MSTNTEVKPVTQDDATPEDVVKLLADPTIVVDRKLSTLIGSIDSTEASLGGKWARCSLRAIEMEWVALTPEEEKDGLSKERAAHCKKGRDIMLKTIMSTGTGKTYKAAQSIRSQILRFAKPSFAVAREKLLTGEMSVRDARRFGAKPQLNKREVKSDHQKYIDLLKNAVRYAIGLQYDDAKIMFDAAILRKELQPDANDAEKAAKNAKDKQEFKNAIEETKALQANKS